MPRTLVCPVSKRVIISIAAFLLLAVAAPAQVRNRIKQNIADTETVTISAPHPLARADFDQRPGRGQHAHQSCRHGVSSCRPRSKPIWTSCWRSSRIPHSPNYHKWLTPEHYAARFGMSDADLAQVSAWLKSLGLTVNGFSRGRTHVFFSGSASQVENAFHTRIQPAIWWTARPASPMPPRFPCRMALSGMVLGFRGLDNFRPQTQSAGCQTELYFTPYREIISSLPPTLPPSITSNRFTPPGWMELEKRLPWWDRPRLTSAILTLSAAPRVAADHRLQLSFGGRHHRVLYRRRS